MIYGLILAGGKGSRLYPLSRAKEPKQFLKILNDKSLLLNTIDRVSNLVAKERIYIVTNKDYEKKIKEEIDEEMKKNLYRVCRFLAREEIAYRYPIMYEMIRKIFSPDDTNPPEACAMFMPDDETDDEEYAMAA